MILRYLIIVFLVHAGSCQTPPPIPRCLIGYMTDVQSWVDYYGRIIATANGSVIDLSYQGNCVWELSRHLRNFTCSGNTSVVYLSMASCQLRQVPAVFRDEDVCGRALSDTVEYVTFYANDFARMDAPWTMYQVGMNATNITTTPDHNATARDWSIGLRGVNFSRLRELDLRFCGIRELEDNVFIGMPFLEKLYLGENNIFIMNSATFRGLKNLVHLDVSRNYEYDENGTYKGLYFDDLNIFTELQNLRSLDFSFTKLAQRNMHSFRSVGRRLQILSICHSGLTNMGANFLAGSSLRYLDVSGNINIFGNETALRGVKSSLKVVYADEVALKNLSVFENLTSLEILRVANNEISAISKKTARTLISLQVLILDMNRLITWFKPVVSLMPNLRLFSIRHNNINLISEEMAKDFENVSYIGLTGNFIVCNCNAREIFEVAMRNEMIKEDEFVMPIQKFEFNNTNFIYHTGFEDVNYAIANRKHIKPGCVGKECREDIVLDISGRFLLFDYYDGEYNCLLVTEGKSTSFGRVPSCKMAREVDVDEVIRGTWNKLYLLAIPLLVLPILILGFVFRRNVRYFFITMRNSATLSLINKDEVIDENTIFNYAVFVSYCNDDRAWVLDHLLPNVETDCNVSVCLHERDFMVGLSILENIVSCMDRSKCIMLIISKKFLMSQWCQFEMHLAQHRLLETRREDLILVLLEDIPRRLRPNTLHYLMLTNTYIVWPKEEAEQVLFWRRLKKSLVTHKMRQPDNVSLA